MQEMWKKIISFEDYEISNLGRVRKNNKILKQYIDKIGYCNVTLINNKQRKFKKVHRLVAEAFINNDDNLPVINHKNGIKTDNTVNNLEWSSYKNNSIHAVNMGLIKTKKVKCIETNKIYKSIKEASKDVGVFDGHIIKVCKGLRKTTGGFHWEYLEGSE